MNLFFLHSSPLSLHREVLLLLISYFRASQPVMLSLSNELSLTKCFLL